jgi:hypothetical protein
MRRFRDPRNKDSSIMEVQVHPELKTVRNGTIARRQQERGWSSTVGIEDGQVRPALRSANAEGSGGQILEVSRTDRSEKDRAGSSSGRAKYTRIGWMQERGGSSTSWLEEVKQVARIHLESDGVSLLPG